MLKTFHFKRFAFRNINTVGTTEIYACGDMSEDAHSAQEAHESSVRGQFTELMKLEKASDLQEMPSLAELGGWQKCAKWVLDEIGDFESMTMKEIVYAIVGKVYEYSKREDL